MDDKTETVLDHTYLRPGIVTRAGAIGLAAIAIGTGALLASYGASFFFNTNSKRLDALAAKVEEIARRPDRTNEVVAKLDDFRREAGKIGNNIATNVASVLEELKTRPFILDNPNEHGTPVNGDVITTEVTVFKTVSHGNGKVVTGWKYPNGASANQPPADQFCYWTDWGGTSGGPWVHIDLAQKGARLPSIADGVPRLEDALKKCVWW